MAEINPHNKKAKVIFSKSIFFLEVTILLNDWLWSLATTYQMAGRVVKKGISIKNKPKFGGNNENISLWFSKFPKLNLLKIRYNDNGIWPKKWNKIIINKPLTYLINGFIF